MQPGLRGRGCCQRLVVEVLRVKRKPGEPGGGVNYVLVLECGHKAYRNLWRECDYVGCKDCSNERKAKKWEGVAGKMTHAPGAKERLAEVFDLGPRPAAAKEPVH